MVIHNVERLFGVTVFRTLDKKVKGILCNRVIKMFARAIKI